MFINKSMSRIFSVFLVLIFLLTGVLPVQAESLASPLYASGDFAWAKSIGGTGDDFGNSIAVDLSGNVYTTGYFEGTVDFDPGVGITNLTSVGFGDIFISKSDSSGNFVWAKSMGGADFNSGFEITVDSSGNVYTTGQFESTADFDPGAGTFNLISAGGDDVFVSKLDSNGNFIWAKSMGGNSAEAGSGIAVDSNGNVYTTGFFQVLADFDPGAGVFNLTPVGSTDIFVSKLDSSGNFVWAKSMGGTSSDFGVSVKVDSSNNVHTTGRFQNTVDFDPGAGTANLTSTGLRDIFVSKLDSSGNFVWAKSIGGAGNDIGSDSTLDSSGNIYTTGEFEGTVDFDPGAGTANITSAGGSEIFVSKLDSGGNFVWAKSMGGTSAEAGNGIAVDSNGNIYTTGYFFEGTVDFDPGAGTFNLTSVGLEDAFVSKLDSSGNFVWAKSMGGTGTEIGSAIALDSSGSVYTTGYFDSTTADFDPGAGTANLTSAGLSDIFVSKLEGSSGNQAVQVTIDIKPGSARNRIEIEEHDDESILVAILSTAQFNAPKQVDKKSLTFGRTGDENSLKLEGHKHTPDCKKKDVNKDRLPDLVCNFKIHKTGFQLGDTVGILKGLTVDSLPFEGSDSVVIKSHH